MLKVFYCPRGVCLYLFVCVGVRASECGVRDFLFELWSNCWTNGLGSAYGIHFFVYLDLDLLKMSLFRVQVLWHNNLSGRAIAASTHKHIIE